MIRTVSCEERCCWIVGAGEFYAPAFSPRQGDFIIAADAGYRYLEQLGVRPDCALGDFDSLGWVPDEPDLKVFSPIKDDPDMMLAAREGLSRGFRRFELLGGLGGRLAHSVANLQVLEFLSRRGARAFLTGEHETATAISDGESISFSAQYHGYLSAFCLSSGARVTMRNLKYELDGGTLEPFRPLGLSNEFIGRDAMVRVERGTIVLMWETQ